jgi:hypothetical protein
LDWNGIRNQFYPSFLLRFDVRWKIEAHISLHDYRNRYKCSASHCQRTRVYKIVFLSVKRLPRVGFVWVFQ